MFRSPSLLQKTLMTTLIAASLSGCNDNEDTPKTAQLLRAEVTLIPPTGNNQSVTANSNLKVMSGSTQVATGKTFANGNFTLTTTPLTRAQLKQLRVELNACSDKLNALTCTMLSASLNPAQLAGVAQVNLRSTLVDRLQRQTNLSLAQAEQRITAYLGLATGITSQDTVSQNLFDPTRFVSDHLLAAQATGATLDQQIGKTVDAIATNPNLQQRYTPLLGLNPIVKFVGLELVKGALGKVGGEAVGKAMSFLGLGAEFEQSERHAEIMNQLNAVNSQLRQISGQINEIQNGVKETIRKIEQIDQKLETAAQQQRIQKLLTQTTALVEYTEQIKVTLFDLQNAHQLNSSLQPNERRRLKAAIETLLAKRTVLSASLEGTVGNASLIANLVEVKFPQPTVVDPLKVTFFGPDTINSIMDVVKYYDELNVMSYYLFMEYYNSLDQESNVAAQDCPDILSSSTAINRQCQLYHEVKSARDSYLKLSPQESLPVSSMFLQVFERYDRNVLPYVIYPAGDFNNIQFNRNTGTTQAVLNRIVYPSLTPQQQTEVTNLTTWTYLETPSTWFGMFVRPAEGGKIIKDVAIANGAPASAFVTASGKYAWWSVSSGNDWQQRSTIINSNPTNPSDDAKFVVLGTLKNMSDVEKYMGTVIASRFK